LRVLLVDDADDMRVLVQSYFADTTHELCIVQSGEHAVQELRSRRFDVVLMDVHMPQMDGLAATRMIRCEERSRGLPSTPVLALTADAAPDCLTRCLTEGFSGYLTKPISRRELLDAVERNAGRIAESGSATDAPPAAHAEAAAVGCAGGVVVQVDQALLGLMPKFLRNRQQDVERMREAVARDDYATVWTLGHNMKGSAAGYRLARVGDLGGALADAAKRRDREGVARLASELERYLGRVELRCAEDL
jgi:CheY-like chemotaxis protein/HPt (histidine-containing phosphotransfer) domain-containing protein